MQPPKIFFLHNPKAGGTSLHSVLHKLTSPGRVAPVFSNSPYAHRADKAGYDQFAGYDLYAGHYGYNEFRRLGEDHLLMTNFRDPADRVHSLYRYWRNNVDLSKLHADPRDVALVGLAQDLSFSDFIRSEDPDLRLYLSNWHFRQLLSSGWEQPSLGRTSQWLVKDRIRRMPWFYVAELPAISAYLLQQAFPRSQPITIPRDNVSRGRAEPMSDEDRAHLRRINTRDYSIYDFAVRLQTSRLDQIFIEAQDAVPQELALEIEPLAA